MQLVKSFYYLEVKSLYNKFKNWSNHKLQLSFYLVFIILSVCSFFISPINGVSEIPMFSTEYLKDIAYLSSLFILLYNIHAGCKRLCIGIPSSSSPLLFYLPVNKKRIIHYFFLKQVILKLIITMFGTYFFFMFITGRIFVSGWSISWIGFFILLSLGDIISIFTFSIRKRFNIKLNFIPLLIIIGLAVYLSKVALTSELSQVVIAWREIYSHFTILFNWFVKLLINPVLPNTLDIFSIISSVAILIVLFIATILFLPDCKEDFLYILKQRQDIDVAYKDNKDYQESIILFLSPERNNRIAKWEPGYGIIKALFWKELIEWERIKKEESKYMIPASIVIGFIVGMLVIRWELPNWLILISVLINNFGDGGTVIRESRRSLIYNLSATWNKKLKALAILPFIENTAYYLISVVTYFGVIYYNSGFFDLSRFIMVMILIGLLDLLFITLGLLGHLVSTNLIGVFKKWVQISLLLIHFIVVVITVSFVDWNLGGILVIYGGLSLLIALWYRIVVDQLNITSYEKMNNRG